MLLPPDMTIQPGEVALGRAAGQGQHRLHPAHRMARQVIA